MVEDEINKGYDGEEDDIEKFLEERRKMDAAFEEKFTKVLTVMFTDLKGSTSIAETEGDLGTRMMLKHHDEIVMPAIKENNGALVKSIGDGTLSHFPTAQDGVRAAVRIQRELTKFNATKTLKIPIQIRIGLHTGKVITEKKGDILGDVVNTASRFESTAAAGEIYFSEETYNALSDKDETFCKFIKMATLKGKKEPVKVFKAYWDPNEARDEVPVTEQAAEGEVGKGIPPKVKLALIIIIPIVLIFILLMAKSAMNKGEGDIEKRSIHQSVDEPRHQSAEEPKK